MGLVIGYSLGSAVATAASNAFLETNADKLSGLLLFNPFTSMWDQIHNCRSVIERAAVYTWQPFFPLARASWKLKATIGKPVFKNIPIMVCSNKDDGTVCSEM